MTAAFRWVPRAAALAIATMLVACERKAPAPAPDAVPKGSEAHIRAVTSSVDEAWIRANATATNEWPSHGLDAAETRFSRLAQVNDGNVDQLGLAWSYDLESTRGVEATPLVVDGDHVRDRLVERRARDRRAHRSAAVDLRSAGAARARAQACCDVVNRGVALYKRQGLRRRRSTAG